VAIETTARALLRVTILAALLAGLTAVSVGAQGKGLGKGKGKSGSGPTTSGSAAPTGAAMTESAGFRQFGSWLDDASILTPGHAWTAISFGHYRSAGGRQTDFPVVDAGIGFSTRAQFGISVPYYRLHFTDGTNAGGLGDVVLSGKFMLIDPTRGKRSVGLAISPVLEISDDPLQGSPAVTWAAPVSGELRGSRYRVFGSTGYFSRGALFASAAIEVPVKERVVVSSALSLMRSTNDNAGADAMGLSKGRADVTASAAYFMTPSVAIFGGTGRTIGNADGAGTTFMLTGGVSLTFAPRVGP
jgi:hypothetical protein